MRVKTNELIGAALDWAVAKCEGLEVVVVTVEDQVMAHERVTREHYSDEEWVEHLIGWNKHVLPTLRPRLAALDSEGFPNGFPFMSDGRGMPISYSSEWNQGGPIIENERISVERKPHGYWIASFQCNYAEEKEFLHLGPTPLVAAMRCYVASKLGDKIDVPEGLLK